MQVTPHVEALRADLAAIAGVGDDVVASAAQRLSQALTASLGLRLLDVLHEAAPSQPADEGLSARITLRLPESLKASVDAAAAREGLSVNAWLLRALTRAVSSPAPRVGSRLTGFGKS